MASKTVVELYDDLDGGRADETVRFALDGVEYEIDLSTPHAAALRDTLAVYIGRAHRPARRKSRADDSRTENRAETRTEPRAESRAEPRVAVAEPARVESRGTPRNGRNGNAGKASDSAKLTAEIRRLASETAQKAQQARAAAERAADEAPLDIAAEPVKPAAPGTSTVGPVPALTVPFLEAGR